jgi:hypothetical protein
MAGFASTLPNQRSSVRCKPQTLHLRELIQFSSFSFLKNLVVGIYLFIYLFLVGINIYCILCVVMEGTKSVYKWKKEERRERERE